MPMYEMFCLARPQLARAQKAELFRSAAKTIFNGGGIVTDLKNFGERDLAYNVRRAGSVHSKAFAWQIGFAANPAVLKKLQTDLKIDERIVRHIFIKKQALKPMPTTHTIKKKAIQRIDTSQQ